MRMLLAGMMMLAGVAVAAPAGKGPAAEPTAADFPAWTGVTAKNYITGRRLIGPADLRQRVTIVAEFDAAKTGEQLEEIGALTRRLAFSATGEGTSWETFEPPHGAMVIFVARNFTTADVIKDGMKCKEADKKPNLTACSTSKVSIYHDVTFEGAPSAGGQYPFVYVMGHEGKEPLYKGAWAKDTMKKVSEAIAKDKAAVEEASLTWKPYYGYVAEPKFFAKDLEKSLKTGKPTLEVVEAKLLKSVTANDAERAKEAQMLYDGLEQTKSDMMYVAQLSFSAAPHVAAYKANMVVKQWPKTKKMLSDLQNAIKANGGASALVKIYPKLAMWADPNFTCKNVGEAKKIVAELNKMKKMLAPLKEDAKNITVQNGALILDGMLDELISIIPAKVPQK